MTPTTVGKLVNLCGWLAVIALLWCAFADLAWWR